MSGRRCRADHDEPGRDRPGIGDLVEVRRVIFCLFAMLNDWDPRVMWFRDQVERDAQRRLFKGLQEGDQWFATSRALLRWYLQWTDRDPEALRPALEKNQTRNRKREWWRLQRLRKLRKVVQLREEEFRYRLQGHRLERWKELALVSEADGSAELQRLVQGILERVYRKALRRESERASEEVRGVGGREFFFSALCSDSTTNVAENTMEGGQDAERCRQIALVSVRRNARRRAARELASERFRDVSDQDVVDVD